MSRQLLAPAASHLLTQSNYSLRMKFLRCVGPVTVLVNVWLSLINALLLLINAHGGMQSAMPTG